MDGCWKHYYKKFNRQVECDVVRHIFTFNLLNKFSIIDALIILDKPSKDNIYKAIRNIPNIKVTDINHFSAFDIVKYKKIVFSETSIKELEKRYA